MGVSRCRLGENGKCFAIGLLKDLGVDKIILSWILGRAFSV